MGGYHGRVECYSKYDSAACLNLTLLLDVETKGFRQGLEELVEGIDKGFRGRKEIY